MKVRDLIDKLKWCNPDAEIDVGYFDSKLGEIYSDIDSIGEFIYKTEFYKYRIYTNKSN